MTLPRNLEKILAGAKCKSPIYMDGRPPVYLDRDTCFTWYEIEGNKHTELNEIDELVCWRALASGELELVDDQPEPEPCEICGETRPHVTHLAVCRKPEPEPDGDGLEAEAERLFNAFPPREPFRFRDGPEWFREKWRSVAREARRMYGGDEFLAHRREWDRRFHLVCDDRKKLEAENAELKKRVEELEAKHLCAKRDGQRWFNKLGKYRGCCHAMVSAAEKAGWRQGPESCSPEEYLQSIANERDQLRAELEKVKGARIAWRETAMKLGAQLDEMIARVSPEPKAEPEPSPSQLLKNQKHQTGTIDGLMDRITELERQMREHSETIATLQFDIIPMRGVPRRVAALEEKGGEDG